MNVLIKARERWLGQSIPQDYTRVHSDESAPPTPRASIWSRSSSIWSTATFDDPAWTKTPTFQSRRVALLILALLAAFFAGSHLSTIRERYANEKDDLAEVETVVPTARIVVQFNQDNGAFVQLPSARSLALFSTNYSTRPLAVWEVSSIKCTGLVPSLPHPWDPDRSKFHLARLSPAVPGVCGSIGSADLRRRELLRLERAPVRCSGHLERAPVDDHQ